MLFFKSLCSTSFFIFWWLFIWTKNSIHKRSLFLILFPIGCLCLNCCSSFWCSTSWDYFRYSGSFQKIHTILKEVVFLLFFSCNNLSIFISIFLLILFLNFKIKLYRFVWWYRNFWWLLYIIRLHWRSSLVLIHFQIIWNLIISNYPL